MKQYTSKDQTAKLIELGFPKPQGWGNKDISNGMSIALYKDGREDFNYSVGELIEFIPRWIKPRGGLEIVAESDGWLVMHGHDPFDPQCTKPELIDALFEYCVTLKEEGVI